MALAIRRPTKSSALSIALFVNVAKKLSTAKNHDAEVG
jgi:hypothetical protein